MMHYFQYVLVQSLMYMYRALPHLLQWEGSYRHVQHHLSHVSEPFTMCAAMQDTHTAEHVAHLLTNKLTRRLCKPCISSTVYVPFITYPRPLDRRRVFILGPSHHVYLAGCALSSTTHYETPLYNLEIDQMST